MGTAPCPTPVQVRLKALTPQTEEEKIEYSIAAERRRMRLVHKDTLKDLLTRSPRETGTVSRRWASKIALEPLVTPRLLGRVLVAITVWGFGGALDMEGSGSAPPSHTPGPGGLGGVDARGGQLRREGQGLMGCWEQGSHHPSNTL